MAAPAPDPSPDPAPDPSPDPTPDPTPDPSPEAVADSSAEASADPPPDPERARRTAGRLLVVCVALTAMVGLFQFADIIGGLDQYGGMAWLGVIVATLAVLALIALYGACALDRATLHTRILGRLDLFQVATVVLLVAITAGILIPTRNTTALALLLPWGITYWVHGLGAVTPDAATPDAATSDEP